MGISVSRVCISTMKAICVELIQFLIVVDDIQVYNRHIYIYIYIYINYIYIYQLMFSPDVYFFQCCSRCFVCFKKVVSIVLLLVNDNLIVRSLFTLI